MFDAVKGMMDTVRKVDLRNPIELDALAALLAQRVDPAQFGTPELKKGLMGKRITYPKVDRVIPTITVKGNQVTIKRVEDASQTSVSVGKAKVTLDKDLRGLNRVRTANAGTEYFQAIAEAITQALADQ